MRPLDSPIVADTDLGRIDVALRVVLVEDDAGDAFLVQELLRGDDLGAALSVRWVTSLAATEEIEPTDVDCLLVDLGLPDGTGIDVVRSVLDRFPRAAVVVLTGLSDRRLAVRAVGFGAQDYLIKDEVNAGLLERTIQLAVERRRTERAAVSLAEAALRQESNKRLVSGLLPRFRVDDPALTIASRYVPGTRGEVLGGDFIDAVELPDGRVRLIIGDVSGHGPDEAAIGVNLRIAWRAVTLAGGDAATTLAQLQDLLISDVGRPEMFATATDVTLSADRRSIRLRHAGHPAPLLVTERGVQDLDGRRAPMLGLDLADLPPEITFDLPERWLLVAFTDGLVEGSDGPPPERWGTSGLTRHLSGEDAGGPEDVADLLLAEATRRNGGPLADDVALLVVGRDWPGRR